MELTRKLSRLVRARARRRMAAPQAPLAITGITPAWPDTIPADEFAVIRTPVQPIDPHAPRPDAPGGADSRDCG